MIDSNIEKLQRMAADYFGQKVRKPYYEVVALNEDNLSEVIYLEPFTDKEFQELLALRVKYGEDGYIDHLDEVITDPDELEDMTCGQVILRVNLDNPCYKYEFGYHELVKDRLIRYSIDVIIFDETYIKALTLLLSDPEMNMNKLQFADSFLYDSFYSQIVHSQCDDGYYLGSRPFLVTMDELQRDADAIRAQHPELNQQDGIGYYCNI